MATLIASTALLFLSASPLWSNGMAYPMTSGFQCSQDNQVKCGNDSRCIPRKWFCDGEPDCPDSSDEEGCGANVTCQANEWRCVSGQCIDERWRCDKERDCSDGSDELECPSGCLDNLWQCDESEACIPKAWVCDGDNDCRDHSDEQVCSTPAEPNCNPSTMWRCEGDGRSKCILISWRCDGDVDCAGGSDEKGCQYGNSTSGTLAGGNNTVAVQQGPSCNSTQEFACLNGRCVWPNSTCDSVDDCGDGSDETDCEGRVPCDPNTHWECPGIEPTPKCIEKSRVCDGVRHCADGADESDCQPRNCFPKSQWRCSGYPMQWIPMEFRCDGRPDCRDNSDESDCRMLESNQILPLDI